MASDTQARPSDDAVDLPDWRACLIRGHRKVLDLHREVLAAHHMPQTERASIQDRIARIEAELASWTQRAKATGLRILAIRMPLEEAARTTRACAMNTNRKRDEFDFDLDDLLHPAQAFEHPDQVVNDPDLTLNEKRAILASWASDACAVEAAPALRCAPGGRRPVSVDDILEALRALDRAASNGETKRGWLRRKVRRRAIPGRGSPGDSAQGLPN
jgi:hypothetical protein